MEKQLYVRPMVVEKKSRIRTSILAGSNSTTDPTGGSVTGKDYSIETRERQNLKFEF